MEEINHSLEVFLTSGRTIEQGITLVGIKISEEAKKATAVCYLDPNDMEKLDLIENSNIKIKTSEGEIVVSARFSKDAPHEGIVFMPLGIYANWITPPGSAGIGVPQYKGIKAIISPTKEKISSVEELINKLTKSETNDTEIT
ncbi:MAG TPA: molybdopterin dinucleotide binding domain-containing protein [candidate division Zixibacteria bacterium]|nr:molybdopterin dinucleotide binding domain-containing protein [candidate division Zixibacteria bacterium]